MGRWVRPRVVTLSEEDRELLRWVASRTAVLALADDDRRMLEALIPPVPPKPKHWYSSWLCLSRVGKVIGGVLVIGSLLFAALQTMISADAAKSSARAVEANAWASASMAALQTDQTFAASDRTGDLEPYFEEKARIPASNLQLYLRFKRLAVMQLDLMDAYRGEVDFLPPSFINKESVRRWLSSSFASSPDLCKVLDQEQDSYSDEFVNDAAAACRDGNGYDLTPHRPLP